MNGRPPNCSKTGSQTEVRKNAKPNLCRARAEPCQSSKTKRMVISTTEAANKNVTSRTISSPSRRRLKKEREPKTWPALGRVVLEVDMSSKPRLLDGVESLYLLSDYFLGQLRVGKSLRIVLSVGQHPLYETFDGIAFGGIGKFRRNQEPSEARDGISGLARGVGNGNPEVVWHVLCRASGCRGHARKISLNELAG